MKALLLSILNDYQKLNIEADIYIIADAQDKTSKFMPDKILHADESEFFSRTEFAEIASAIFNCFGFVRVFYSEIEFINYILHNNLDHEECIVFNFSRDGITNGKKSLIPAFCDLLNIKYTGCNAFVISLLRNKHVYTDFLKANNIIVPKTFSYLKKEDIKSIVKYFQNQKVIVKNSYESASIGLTEENIFTINNTSYKKIYQLLNKMQSDILLIQEFIDGLECEVFVLQYKRKYYALDPVEIIFHSNNNFIDSITSNTYNYEFKVIDSNLKTAIKKAAIRSAELLGIKDYARFDFRIKDGVPYLIDIAGTPYTIYHSSIAHLFVNYYQLSYKDIYKVLLTCMLSNYKSTA